MNRRLWVRQEVALASRNLCLCGPFEFDLHDTLLVASWLHLYSRILTRSLWDMQALSCASAMFYNQDEEQLKFSDPFRVLHDSRDFECLDPRDKVYGSLGLFELISYVLPPGLLPDYTLSLAEVYTRVMSCALSSDDDYRFGTNKALNSISHRSQQDIHVEGLASWIPRWFRPWQSGLDAFPMRGYLGGALYSHIESYFISDTSSYPRWHVGGFPLGQIGELSHSPVTFDWRSFYEHYPVALRSLKGHEPTDLTIFELLTAELEPSRVAPDRRESFVVWLDQFTHGIGPGFEVTETSERWTSAVQEACSCRSVGITDAGVPGLFPSMSRQSDHIVWLDRAEYPTILRPSGDYFEVIGQAFISGLRESMDEELPKSKPRLYILI